MSKKKFSGINIQFPISQFIIQGKKTIETRTYPIPKKYINKEMLLIETPGKLGLFKARYLGIIKFQNSFKYSSETEFYRHQKFHCVSRKSPWRWDNKKPKWGWPVEVLEIFKRPIITKKRSGIIFSKDIEL